MSRSWSRYVLVSTLCLACATSLLGSTRTARADDAPKGVAGWYRAALEHESHGRDEAACLAYERVLALDPEHRAARRALGYEEVDGYWLRGDDLKRARGLVHHAGRWMTAEEFADATRPLRTTQAQRAAERTVLGLLAEAARSEAAGSEAAGSKDGAARLEARLALVPPHLRLAPLAKALRVDPPAVRRLAAAALGRLGDPLAVPALLVRTIRDPQEGARREAALALRAIDAPGTWMPLVRALGSRTSDVRIRSARALGVLGDAAAAPYVITRWEKRSGNFSRVYFAQASQRSFLQDFDVEVAATSFIADPIVGVLQEGVVHAVRIHATEQTFQRVERVAYREALTALAGEDRGDDVASWRRWWEEQ